MKEELKITCTGFDYVDLDRLRPLQGGLKSLSKESYQKLRASILEHGIAFPFFVWRDEDKECWTVDGHMRERALRLLRKEGYIVPKVPVDYIAAKNETDARRKLLIVNSRYGRIQEEALYFYLEENNIAFDSIKATLDLPEFDTKHFEQGWIMRDYAPEPPKPKTIRGPGVLHILHDGQIKHEILLPDEEWSMEFLSR